MIDMTKHLLTKSNFILGGECLFKLKYYKEKYPSAADENEMLKFFAEGGFMVEAIAHAVMTRNPDVEFEKTLNVGRYSARLDAFEQFADHIVLTEIKARSVIDSGIDQFLTKRTREVTGDWLPYMYDITFQVMVTEAMFPGVLVVPQLCVVNKNKPCGIDGVYANIDLIADDESRDFSLPRAVYTGDLEALRADHFLEFINVRECVDLLMPEVKELAAEMLDFLDGKMRRVEPQLGLQPCKSCEYRDADQTKDGFSECWGKTPPRGAHIIDLYSAGNGTGELKAEIADRIDNRKLQLTDIPDSVLELGGARGQTRRNQVAAARTGTEIVTDNMASDLAELTYPLHFIDFETSSIPVPYLAGMKPFEMVAFQFSCHTIASQDSTELIHHEWLNLQDTYPNAEFMKELRKAIGHEGTVLIWSNHEVNTLRQIRRQLRERGLFSSELDQWAETLIGPTPGVGEEDKAKGARVVDLLKISEANYCHPSMKGSHSIKKVLDAIWSDAPHLWKDSWFSSYYMMNTSGQVIDPYRTLSLASPEMDLTEFDSEETDAVSDGVAAMRAYQDMLFGMHRNDPVIRDRMRGSLLRYCGLDTAAMVIIWKHWTKITSKQS